MPELAIYCPHDDGQPASLDRPDGTGTCGVWLSIAWSIGHRRGVKPHPLVLNNAYLFDNQKDKQTGTPFCAGKILDLFTWAELQRRRGDLDWGNVAPNLQKHLDTNFPRRFKANRIHTPSSIVGFINSNYAVTDEEKVIVVFDTFACVSKSRPGGLPNPWKTQNPIRYF